jgi:hypothetical protein
MMKLTAASLSLLTLLAASCGSGGDHTSRSSTSISSLGEPAEGTAMIVGTCLDGATGEPLSGVEVTGPSGATARSDDHGRFVLADLPEGLSGELVATAPDGRKATNVLRPLKHARLEVVLHLR